MNVNAKEIGARISKVRKEMGLTQLELSYELDAAWSTVAKIETGCRVPSVDMLVALSEILKVSLDYLVLGREK